MAIQQMLLGAGKAPETTYLNDVFNIDAYVGDGYHPTLNSGGTTSRNIVNGIDFTQGGLAIVRRRDSASWWQWADTVNGATNALSTNSNNALDTNRPNGLKTFNNNGVTIGYDGLYNFGGSTVGWNNAVAGEYVLTSLRKSKGFLDIVEFTETGSDASISHQLGSVPGMIIIKTTSRTSPWFVYHRASGEGKWLKLNETGIATSFSSGGWGSVTSSSFNFTHQVLGYGSGTEWIAYVFGGGESDAATARSCSFNGSSSDLQQSSSSDLAFGTGDYTVECWVKPNSLSSTLETLLDSGGNSGNSDTFYFGYSQSQVHVGTWNFYVNQATATMVNGQWTHIAACRSGSTMRIFKNGKLLKSVTDNTNWASNANITIGRNRTGAQWVNGSISNLRVIKGTALYTSSFRPPTEPLTNVTNTVLLTLNNSSVTGATVSPGTWTNSNVTASTDSPFDDPAGFVYGDSEEGLIKCGSYIGNGSTTGTEINLGFEPQFLLCKKIDNQGGGTNTSNWHILDSMRGTGSGGAGVADDVLLMPNLTNSEVTIELADFTSTGFKNTSNRDAWNYEGDEYLYLAIRRPDGYVGKQIEDATKCFAMDTGAGSDTIPNFDSGFPVDFQLLKQPASTSDWYAGSRLLMKNFLETNDYTGETAANPDLWRFDDSKGWNSYDGYNSAYQSYMWKRHAGFDVLAYKSDELENLQLNHSLGKIPEMIFFKSRDANQDWGVYHKDLNGGSNPEDYYMVLNRENAETGGSSNTDRPLASAPTSTHISLLSTSSFSNYSTHRYIAMLFTSIAGISKCGGYSGSSTVVTVDCGFVPRLVIMKKRQNTGASHNGWLIFDTLRGIADGGDSYMFLDTTSAANASYDVLDLVDTPTVKGFSIPTLGSNNDTGATYVYYAHA